MKEYKIFHCGPENPLKVSQEMCDRVSMGLKDKMGQYYKSVLPQSNAITDVHLYKLDYLNSALDLLKECKGFKEHISEYRNNHESTFFVTVMADVLTGHGLMIELEPDIPNHNRKKPDLFAKQTIDGLGVYFECKQPKDDTKDLLKEQREIFDGIEKVISDEYSLAMFYERKLNNDEILKLRDLIHESFRNDKNIFENRQLVDDCDLGVRVVISGMPENIEKSGLIEMSGIPNFSDEKGYSNVNGINRYGKNIVFLKSASKNALGGQLKNSREKVPEGYPYVICIDLSGPRFDIYKSTKYFTNHFEKGDYSNISGILLVNHGLVNDGIYNVELHYIDNKNSKFRLPFLNDFFYSSLSVDVNYRYKHNEKV